MAEKSSKIDDIKRSDKVTPTTTARPILVTNHPTMASDPMMAPGEEKKDEAPAEQPMSHTAKTIKPLDESLSADADEPAAVEADASADPESPGPSDKTAEVPEKPVDKPSQESESTAVADKDDPVKRDGEAEISAEEAAAAEAKAKREDELEALIASGKYAVPINAVQRKRSRIASLMLLMLALLLALLLLDAAADVGIVKLPSSVPHTHFFSAK